MTRIRHNGPLKYKYVQTCLIHLDDSGIDHSTSAMTSIKKPSFLEYNIKLMKTICMWPLDSKSYTVNLLNSVYAVTMAISLALVSVGQIVEIFVSPDLSSMASAVDLATLTASGLFKFVYIIIYNHHFQDLVAKIDANYVESASPNSPFRTSKWVKNSKLYSTVYSFSASITLLGFFVTIPILAKHIPFLSSRPLENTQPSSLIDSEEMFSHNFSEYTTSLSAINVTQDLKIERFFPMKCWFPFDVSWSPLYEIVFLWEIYPLMGSGHLYLVSDSFFFMIIYLSCGQMEILKDMIRSLREKYAVLTSENQISIKNRHFSTNGKLDFCCNYLICQQFCFFAKYSNENCYVGTKYYNPLCHSIKLQQKQ